eukprot:728872-Pelagomonas_calceolata.AAC.6
MLLASHCLCTPAVARSSAGALGVLLACHTCSLYAWIQDTGGCPTLLSTGCSVGSALRDAAATGGAAAGLGSVEVCGRCAADGCVSCDGRAVEVGSSGMTAAVPVLGGCEAVLVCANAPGEAALCACVAGCATAQDSVACVAVAVLLCVCVAAALAALGGWAAPECGDAALAPTAWCVLHQHSVALVVLGGWAVSGHARAALASTSWCVVLQHSQPALCGTCGWSGRGASGPPWGSGMLLGTLLAGTSGVSCSGARGVSMLPSCPAACLWGGDCCLGWLRCAGGFGSLRVLAVLYIREEGSDRAEGRGGGTTAAAVGAVACVDADVCPGGGQGADAKGCGAVARWPCDPPCWLTTGAPRVRALCTPLLPACCASSPLTSRRQYFQQLVPMLPQCSAAAPLTAAGLPQQCPHPRPPPAAAAAAAAAAVFP